MSSLAAEALGPAVLVSSSAEGLVEAGGVVGFAEQRAEEDILGLGVGLAVGSPVVAVVGHCKAVAGVGRVVFVGSGTAAVDIVVVPWTPLTALRSLVVL